MSREEPMTVEGVRFAYLLDNLVLTPTQRAGGNTAWRGVARRLNQLYWDIDGHRQNTLLIGSWGKRTAVRPPTDIDLLFVLPNDLKDRYRGMSGAMNAPSRVLQLVRNRLLGHYPATAIRGDGPIISVPLRSMRVEVVPVFKFGERFQSCETSGGGTFRVFDPRAELRALENSNRRTRGSTKDLIRLAKCWRYCDTVPLKAFAIELLTIAFLNQWRYAPVGIDEYPRMLVQFFDYLVRRSGGRVSVPGANETVWLGDAWKGRAERAASRARHALSWANAGNELEAGRWWQAIFGTYVPMQLMHDAA